MRGNGFWPGCPTSAVRAVVQVDDDASTPFHGMSSDAAARLRSNTCGNFGFWRIKAKGVSAQ